MCSKAEEKSKVICKVCGSELELVKKNHYVATDNVKTGTFAALATTEEQWYDAFDCPICGSQYIAGERKRKVRNVIFRELQEDLVSDNVVKEDSFDEEPENIAHDINIEQMPTCFGKELKDADEECIGCEQLGRCLSAPECFGKFKEMMHVKECCTMCNMNILNKCQEVSRKILVKESLKEPPRAKKKVLAKKQDEEKSYPLCIGNQSIIEAADDECRTCASREECIRRINEARERKEEGKKEEENWFDEL